jgi:hypothetical protein
VSLLNDTVEHVLNRLIAEEAVEIATGREAAVLAHCIKFLSGASRGNQLVDTLAKALLSAPDVGELYATNEMIKDFITESRNPPCPT